MNMYPYLFWIYCEGFDHSIMMDERGPYPNPFGYLTVAPLDT